MIYRVRKRRDSYSIKIDGSAFSNDHIIGLDFIKNEALLVKSDLKSRLADAIDFSSFLEK